METCLIELPLSGSTAPNCGAGSATFSDSILSLFCPAAFAPPESNKAGPRILVVSADQSTTDFVVRLLKDAFDGPVDVALNGVEALELAAVERYALVIADSEMPLMGGFELLLWLHEIQPATAERFVLITNDRSDQEVVRIPPKILTKPLSGERLLATCEKVVWRYVEATCDCALAP